MESVTLQYSSVLSPLAAVLGLVVLILLVVRTPTGICALLVFYPFMDYVPRSPVPGLNAQTVLVGFALMMTLLRTGVRFPPARVTAPVLAFAFVIVMGFFVAGAGVDYFDPSFTTWERFKAVKSRLFTAVLFFIAYWWASDPRRRQQMLESISIALLVVALAAIGDAALNGGKRAMGLFNNSNYTGDLLGIFLVVPLYLIRAGDLSYRRRLLHLVAYGVAGLALILTLSRAAWLAAFVSHCVWLMYERKQVAVLAAAAVVLLGTAAYPLVPEMVRGRIEGTFEGKKAYRLDGPLKGVRLEGSAATRLVLYRIGVDVWADSPIWGHGLDTFRYLVAPYGLKYGMMAGKTAHSLPLKLVTEMGLIGIGGMIWAVFVLLSVGRRVARIRGDRESQLGPLLIGVAAASGVANLFHEDFLLSAISSSFFWITFGVVARYQYMAATEQRRERARARNEARRRRSAPSPAHEPALGHGSG